ncbi:hypothetical protein IMG5_055040 [Ichthyophthirius multifiliis]|uniref:ATP-dependent DNA ligase family profile domain-containing protein n=1 Tax=Ichthyophthirius multifiliis TaxID=5932 RepID=G0QN32_ICHMU|nr:hypothetical protein IMG5_055040 [Ichthyophthirius multifiliis]EGR33361.1 hypothetical protein IMG5_055040 [Ichthyophthirius multifiliis]|eukprot:XP_004037347.1 hypothetical protein IMG5_055040 [Ichthyophthirius multifiliis]
MFFVNFLKIQSKKRKHENKMDNALFFWFIEFFLKKIYKKQINSYIKPSYLKYFQYLLNFLDNDFFNILQNYYQIQYKLKITFFIISIIKFLFILNNNQYILKISYFFINYQYNLVLKNIPEQGFLSQLNYQQRQYFSFKILILNLLVLILFIKNKFINYIKINYLFLQIINAQYKRKFRVRLFSTYFLKSSIDSKKFWEIKLEAPNKTLIRYGKLIQSIEVSNTIKQNEKYHKSIEEAKLYIEKQIQIKKLRGYDLKKENDNIEKKKNNQTGIQIIINKAEFKEDQIQKNINYQEDKEVIYKDKCYFEETSKAWKANFIILKLEGKNIQKIEGQVSLIKKSEQSTIEFPSVKKAEIEFKNLIEEYTVLGWSRFDGKLEEIQQKIKEEPQKKQQQQLFVPQKKQNNQNQLSSKNNLSDMTDSVLSNASDVDSQSQKSNLSGSKLGGSGTIQGVLLANQMPDDFDATGWIGSEKMDGVRAIWTGTNFYSRNGNQFYPPNWFIKGFPKSTLDGELFTKRNDFQYCVSIVKNQNKNNDINISNKWKDIIYLVYDAPKLNLPFSKRIQILQEEIPKFNNQYIKALPHITIENQDHLEEQLQKVLDKEGEGLMLRNPDAFYEQKRSNNLLKVKVFTDEEAKVYGIQNGTGRCQGMMGALLCELKNGIQFKIGSGFNDQQRKRPPKIGSIVTFKYQNLSKNGIPRFPIFLRIKNDNF